ncbi:SMP-30/Gluconolaconase/LRE-like region [Diaporthe helianthi]|uniref:SMP-30/Gluconolaconase/LRE-like region n=1 Tax=Diaporthe helianthi TaxID=158607 RepID=A0A2P5I6D3_DIAHE|nr:SMP-30/Gluconolaconase/LRE-like region [Diaporthe helianthi]
MAEGDPPTFSIFEEEARAIFGDSPTLELLHEDHLPFAHEAGVFIAEDDTMFITSNQFKNPVSGRKQIKISRVKLDRKGGRTTAEAGEINPKGVPMANGGVNYDGGVLFCAQGEVNCSVEPINDVVVHSDGSIWFTDPPYGYEQGIRPRSILPPQVYRFDPKGGVDAKGSTRAVADGFGRPNGICFSPDESIVYITDTDYIHGDGIDWTKPSTVYAFDMATYSGQPFLTNRRLFAFAENGVPDGIKCDVDGNVYSGCGDGVNVWSPGGVLLGKIRVEGGAANFCFGNEGEMFILNEKRLWRATLGESTKGALLHGKGEQVPTTKTPAAERTRLAAKRRKEVRLNKRITRASMIWQRDN